MPRHRSMMSPKQSQQITGTTKEPSRQFHTFSRILLIPAHDATANLSTTSISNSSISTTGHLLTAATSNLSTTTPNNLSAAAPVNLSNTPNSNTTTKLTSKWNPKAENDTTKLEISNDSSLTNLQFINTTIWISSVEFGHCNIPPTTVTNDEILATIFPFKLKKTTTVPLFNGATLKEKLITAMYTDAKVNGHLIKLILDSGLAGSIITRQLMDQLGHQVNRAISTKIITADKTTKTPIGKIDDFFIEVNGIIILIKVLVMKATQYQALVGNNWLTKTNTILDWTTQNHMPAPLIDLEEEKPKPTWKAYQVSWADVDHNELLPILTWNNNDQEKRKEKEKLT
ncbi:hypothetical protein G9A89_015550 [Geosiphon pyriformis]|nr:hypothetical protein G9A89_015550 [Geosiphon pyriformis]